MSESPLSSEDAGRQLWNRLTRLSRRSQAYRSRLLYRDEAYVKGLPAVERLRTLLARRDLFSLIRLHVYGPPSPTLALLLPELDGPRPEDDDQKGSELWERVSARFSRKWNVRINPPVARALIAKAATEGKSHSEVKQEAIQVGLLLALWDSREAQKVRIGKSHRITDIAGRLFLLGPDDDLLGIRTVKPLEPHFPSFGSIQRVLLEPLAQPVEITPNRELPLFLFERWLHRRAIQHAEDRLLAWDYDDQNTPRKRDPLDDLPGYGRVAGALRFPPRNDDEKSEVEKKAEKQAKLELEAAQRIVGLSVEEKLRLESLQQYHHPLEAIPRAEEAREILQRYEGVLQAATPGQREILDLLRAELARGLDLPAAKQAVADHCGYKSVGAIDTMLTRLRGRVSAEEDEV